VALPVEQDSWLKGTWNSQFRRVNMPVDHEFGDQHTELKLSIVEKYLKFFTTALRGKFEELWYIDAFAGTGSRTVRHEERPAGLLDAGEPARVERRRGSARIAIDVSPPFDLVVFIENKPSYFAALEELVASYPNRRIVVVKNDANDALKSLIATNNWRSTRAVLFLDPYGMQLEWSTLEKIAATKAIDVWFLFSLAGLYRQATRDLANIDEHKRGALTRMFGSDAWEEELYPKTMRDDLFEGVTEEPRRRAADVVGLEAYAKSRLETIFAAVLKPLPLPLHERPQRFSLFFCISNDDPKAIGLASRIGNHILKVGMAS
jgi:three-Cys-motif partner protein